MNSLLLSFKGERNLMIRINFEMFQLNHKEEGKLLVLLYTLNQFLLKPSQYFK